MLTTSWNVHISLVPNPSKFHIFKKIWEQAFPHDGSSKSAKNKTKGTQTQSQELDLNIVTIEVSLRWFPVYFSNFISNHGARFWTCRLYY